ncbi:hypothetical protein K474DRAFT_1673307 [Panus rudis PR-1116 ss-1]|nr:hypothetical protein K474DRAFT_1673307 [Panus rudis PR-1116 ss-1]
MYARRAIHDQGRSGSQGKVKSRKAGSNLASMAMPFRACRTRNARKAGFFRFGDDIEIRSFTALFARVDQQLLRNYHIWNSCCAAGSTASLPGATAGFDFHVHAESFSRKLHRRFGPQHGYSESSSQADRLSGSQSQQALRFLNLDEGSHSERRTRTHSVSGYVQVLRSFGIRIWKIDDFMHVPVGDKTDLVVIQELATLDPRMNASQSPKRKERVLDSVLDR